MAPPWEGSIGDDAVAVRGVRSVLGIVVGLQLGWMWHWNGKWNVALTNQVWLAVNVVSHWIVRWLVGDHVVVTPTTGEAFHGKGKCG